MRFCRTSTATGDGETKVAWVADKLDNQGRAMESRETQTTGVHVTKTNRKNIGYDVVGRLAAYDEQNTDSARPDVSVGAHWTGEYDPHNRLVAFNENRQETSLGYHLTTTRQRTKSKTAYDGFGRLTNYQDTSTDGLGSTFVTDWTGAHKAAGYSGWP